jgi:hypothetical protein
MGAGAGVAGGVCASAVVAVKSESAGMNPSTSGSPDTNADTNVEDFAWRACARVAGVAEAIVFITLRGRRSSEIDGDSVVPP